MTDNLTACVSVFPFAVKVGTVTPNLFALAVLLASLTGNRRDQEIGAKIHLPFASVNDAVL